MARCNSTGHEWKFRDDSPKGSIERLCIHCDKYETWSQVADRIIRIDKADGSEEEVPLSAVARIIENNYKRPAEVRAAFDAGERIASPFAYYEIRKAEVFDVS